MWWAIEIALFYTCVHFNYKFELGEIEQVLQVKKFGSIVNPVCVDTSTRALEQWWRAENSKIGLLGSSDTHLSRFDINNQTRHIQFSKNKLNWLNSLCWVIAPAQVCVCGFNYHLHTTKELDPSVLWSIIIKLPIELNFKWTAVCACWHEVCVCVCV